MKPGTIKLKTVRGRINSGNLDGQHKQWLSPIHNKEQESCDMCKALSSIGQPLTKQQVISLAQEMIVGK